MRSRAAALLGPALAAALAAAAAPGCTLHGGRLAILEDNDFFNIGDGLDTDRDYTQGAAVALTLPDADTPDWTRDFGGSVPLFADDSRFHLAFALGQEIYTPEDMSTAAPLPGDRPYAGWLWAGVAVQGRSMDADPLRRRDRADLLQLDLGVVGPASQAEGIQSYWHREVIGIDEPQGWDNQIGNRPGALLTWERRWRALAGEIGGGFGWDGIPRFRARVGNVRVDASLGAEARVGWNLPRDFGVTLVDGTGLEEGALPPAPWALVFGGAEGRAVAWDLFVDGATTAGGEDVESVPFVPESTVGAAVGWGAFSASFAQVWTGVEYREGGRHHRWSRFLLSWTWYF